MKTKRGKTIGVIILGCLFSLLCCYNGYAKTNDIDDLKKGCSTAYCLQGTTASGEKVRSGICAGSEKYLGKTIVIYQRLPDGSVGNQLGVFDCKDTGGTDAIKSGYCIDVWFPDHDTCKGWMNLVYKDGCKGNIYFKVVDYEKTKKD